MNFEDLTAKKSELDHFRQKGGGLPAALVSNLEEWFRIELTYTSNAIEGNTLTRQETALVVEKGITVGGKSLKEHLEATNHAQALDRIHEMASRRSAIVTESDVLAIHGIILKSIDDANAGCYRSVPVRISGSLLVMPNHVKVPILMEDFGKWLEQSAGDSTTSPAALAAEAHYCLVTIHPFADGNGRTARLLMNLILIMHGYPPALIRKRDRLPYLKSLEKAQIGGEKTDYENIIIKAVDRSLDIYLKAARGEDAEQPPLTSSLLKIGQLAKQAGETVPTIRHWTKEGLLEISDLTDSNYSLYSPESLPRIREIQKLKEQRLTLAEIKLKLD